MEVKRGNDTVKIPAWVLVAGVATIGTIVTDICRTVAGKK